MSRSTRLASRWQHAIMDTYGTPPVALVSGSGAVVTDAAGKTYVDMLGGIAVNALGHAHPAVVEAVSKQVATLGHVSNLYIAEPTVALAELLLALAGRRGRVFFANSGAEANEAAFKLSRCTGRTNVVAAVGGFHGRTMGALALTGQPTKADPFRPLPPSVTHVQYGDVAALDAAVTEDTAMVILEPIQGEYGIVVPPSGYLTAAREITARRGALLAARRGADRHRPDRPLVRPPGRRHRAGHRHAGQGPGRRVADRRLPGLRPRVVAAGTGLTRLNLRRQPGRAAPPRWPCFGPSPATGCWTTSSGSASGCATASAGLAGVTEVRGAGLLLGVVLDRPVAATVVEELRTAGFLAGPVRPDVIRLAPPLILSAEQADAFVAASAQVLRRIAGVASGSSAPATTATTRPATRQAANTGSAGDHTRGEE